MLEGAWRGVEPEENEAPQRSTKNQPIKIQKKIKSGENPENASS